jgi:K+:H+ antiporter
VVGDGKTDRHGHVIVVGCGHVGSRVARGLHYEGLSVVGIDQDLATVEALRAHGITTLYGDASYKVVLAAAEPEQARTLVVTLPDFGATRVIVINAQAANPDLGIVVRARDPRSAAMLRSLGVREVVEPELEGGLELLRHALTALKVPDVEQRRILSGARGVI